MSFTATSKKINFDALKEESKLTGDVLAKKEARDRDRKSVV